MLCVKEYKFQLLPTILRKAKIRDLIFMKDHLKTVHSISFFLRFSILTIYETRVGEIWSLRLWWKLILYMNILEKMNHELKGKRIINLQRELWILCFVLFSYTLNALSLRQWYNIHMEISNISWNGVSDIREGRMELWMEIW